jgi:hypothetical protein
MVKIVQVVPTLNKINPLLLVPSLVSYAILGEVITKCKV